MTRRGEGNERRFVGGEQVMEMKMTLCLATHTWYDLAGDGFKNNQKAWRIIKSNGANTCSCNPIYMNPDS
jgi:hypothetical protein